MRRSLFAGLGPRMPSLATGMAAALLALVRTHPARAGEAAGSDVARAAETRGGHRVSLGLLAGPTLPDPSLSDYQWRMTPRIGWGAESFAGIGRYAAGIRVWSTSTPQELGLPGAPAATTVTRTSFELVGRATLAHLAGWEWTASASAGRVHLGYRPDHVSISTAGGPIDVSFAPLDEWIGGGGIGLRRPLAGSWSAGLDLEHRIFALDTAHRAGTTVVSERSTFGDWSARLALTRNLHW
jgi:hypothetical protein